MSTVQVFPIIISILTVLVIPLKLERLIRKLHCEAIAEHLCGGYLRSNIFSCKSPSSHTCKSNKNMFSFPGTIFEGGGMTGWGSLQTVLEFLNNLRGLGTE